MSPNCKKNIVFIETFCQYAIIFQFQHLQKRNLSLKKQASRSPEKTLQTKEGDTHQADGNKHLFKYFGLKYKFHHGTETDKIF